MAEESPAVGSSERRHLERSQRVWDRWSDHYGMSEKDFEPIRRDAIDQLDLSSGDRVLDVGCGPGVNFEALLEAVGPEGRVLGIDLSPAMLASARERVREQGWTNVDVVRADAGAVGLEAGTFDAAVATLSLSVMPDQRAVAETIHRALVPGGSLVVVGMRAIPSGPGRVVNPILTGLMERIANWNADGDVLGALEEVFDEVEVTRSRALGANYTALAHTDPGHRT